ncbi:MAG: UPF0262 family protein [Alphaproteobacteria bacterium]|jgi:uncharacterized protein (UPF0262 family)|nr:UPF0262 family protein [Alphaproteobacteria bacterium]
MPEHQIAQIFLDETSIIRRSPEVEQERAVAIYDLLESNYFAPTGELEGPFHLHLRVEDRSRLILDIRTTEDVSMREVSVPLVPLRRLIRDYFQICESYYDAIKKLTPSQIETVDMARRGLHDEGSDILLERLKETVEVDFDTARRLFTLVCVLHIRG